jgi:hypothetical protein
MMNDPNGYAERVQRVVCYLAEHLDDALNSEVLAFRPITSTIFTARYDALRSSQPRRLFPCNCGRNSASTTAVQIGHVGTPPTSPVL